MNARLDPRMVAASTHRPRPASMVEAAPPRMTPSSHGGLAITAMLYTLDLRDADGCELQHSRPDRESEQDVRVRRPVAHRANVGIEPKPIEALEPLARGAKMK